MGWIADLLQEIPSAARYKILLEQMSAENAELKAKVESLESSLLAADEVIRKQNEAIKQQSTKSHELTSHEIEQKIRLYLTNNPRSTIHQISVSTGIDLKSVREALELYRQWGGVVSYLESPGGESTWSLT